ncbi:MAG: alpha-ketoglutarate-dependent dioxygenase AlkB [Candidatus Rokuibacteriota bacterium]
MKSQREFSWSSSSNARPAPPSGFRYHPDFVSEAEETDLVAGLRALPLAEIRMRGVVARRRTAHFGWTYGYETWRIEPGPPIPDFLTALRARAGGLIGVAAGALAEVLVTEYTPGAGIGWHRDAPMFGVVVGVSLLGACRFRFRRGRAGERGTPEATLEPRSVYVLDGEARAGWQHSIPPAKGLRYSVTFRTLRERPP